jgi:hypothetical protein
LYGFDLCVFHLTGPIIYFLFIRKKFITGFAISVYDKRGLQKESEFYLAKRKSKNIILLVRLTSNKLFLVSGNESKGDNMAHMNLFMIRQNDCKLVQKIGKLSSNIEIFESGTL